jgi:hypothetical protein
LAKDANALDLDELLHRDLSGRSVHLHDVIDLVARHSWWVSPHVYRTIQVVYPRTRRKSGTGEKRGNLVGRNIVWNNEPARDAFWFAVGKRLSEVKGFHVCHIYENGVHDPRHFTNLANLTAFPKALSSLSEWEPVQAVLKYHSFQLYRYKGPTRQAPRRPRYYPRVWQHECKLDPNCFRRWRTRTLSMIPELLYALNSFIELHSLGQFPSVLCMK